MSTNKTTTFEDILSLPSEEIIYIASCDPSTSDFAEDEIETAQAIMAWEMD